MTCSNCGLEGKLTRGLCINRCYQYLQKYREMRPRTGEKLKPISRSIVPFQERFWSRVRKGNKCWTWTAGRQSQGYGTISVGGKPRLATHVSWFIHHNRWPEQLNHNCDNPKCVNPDHLYEGNQQQNSDDKIRRGRFKHGVMFGEDVGTSKLTNKMVLEIRSSTDPTRILAAKYGRHKSTILRARNGKTWSHITPPYQGDSVTRFATIVRK